MAASRGKRSTLSETVEECRGALWYRRGFMKAAGHLYISQGPPVSRLFRHCASRWQSRRRCSRSYFTTQEAGNNAGGIKFMWGIHSGLEKHLLQKCVSAEREWERGTTFGVQSIKREDDEWTGTREERRFSECGWMSSRQLKNVQPKRFHATQREIWAAMQTNVVDFNFRIPQTPGLK